MCTCYLLKHPAVACYLCLCSVAFVVRTAVEQHNSGAMALLFKQPAVQSMGARAIAGLLQTAIQYKNVPAVLQLSKLKSAHDINTAYLSYLLGEAMSLGHEGAVHSLSLLQGHQTGERGTSVGQIRHLGDSCASCKTATAKGRSLGRQGAVHTAFMRS
jgi:hypothetical protein